jgi:hypothetical protein
MNAKLNRTWPESLASFAARCWVPLPAFRRHGERAVSRVATFAPSGPFGTHQTARDGRESPAAGWIGCLNARGRTAQRPFLVNELRVIPFENAQNRGFAAHGDFRPLC